MEEFYNNENPVKNNIPDVSGGFSLALSIMSIFGSSTIIFGVFLGIAAIATGIISRVHHEKFTLNAILGIVIGSIGIFLSCVMFIGVIILMSDPEVMSQLMQYYTYY